MEKRIDEIFEQSIRLTESFLKTNKQILGNVIRVVAEVLQRGNKILLFGNGGSAADAQHLAAEFVNRYLIDRPALPALALTTDTSVLTAISNDFDFADVFAKQIRALGKPGDAAVGISTSGTSANVINGLVEAKRMGLVTIGLGGPFGSPMEEASNFYLSVSGGTTPRIQEVHQVIGHTIVEVVDQILFGPAA